MAALEKTWKDATKDLINRIPKQIFILDDMYQFQSELQELFPKNMHIKDKIRQQLQFLRDEGYIEFVDNRGTFRKLIKNQEEQLLLEEIKNQITEKRFNVEDNWTTVKTRISTNYFRKLVLRNFEYECCVCLFNIEPLLDAAHIRSWKKDKFNRLNPANGLSLCKLHHGALDKGFLRISSDFNISISGEVMDSDNPIVQQLLANFNDKKIKPPIEFPVML